VPALNQHHHIMMWLIAIAALWWVANTVTSIVTKSVMLGEDTSSKGATS